MPTTPVNQAKTAPPKTAPEKDTVLADALRREYLQEILAGRRKTALELHFGDELEELEKLGASSVRLGPRKRIQGRIARRRRKLILSPGQPPRDSVDWIAK